MNSWAGAHAGFSSIDPSKQEQPAAHLRPVTRVSSLLNTRSHSSELATIAQRSQLPA